MSDKKARFRQQYPVAFFLDKDQPDELTYFLQDRGWIEPYETVLSVSKPGEGNMNYVLRVKTEAQTFIIKQARPWVEKYPQIGAPVERVEVEAQFYRLVTRVPELRPFVPVLLGFDGGSFILMMQDLGIASDYTEIYRSAEPVTPADLVDLLRFLSGLHAMEPAPDQFPANQSLKKLNHEHIFRYPYLPDNGLDLNTVQEGLAEIAVAYKQDEELKLRVEELGQVYLSTGTTLIHGDYYPGSWLKTAGGPRVIDPEFAYLGRAEFDLGVLVAHLMMARTPDTTIRMALDMYQRPEYFDPALFHGFCGAEVIRRLIGLAQLPLDLTLDEKAELLAWARELVLQPEAGNIFSDAK
ncbi:phosphotransferase [Telluribacter sp. SYSU D00476]|uniref:phosphotransferase n=1 Tax=Telluribacter sp. SYSU D00476 TaxID=2811430 RepID=UPI001FF3E795|nr:phosphotransferase [Telluribacter sp. SYSU D00476]